jgi:hypothetical protein
VPKVISPSDPQSAWTAKANKRVQFGYGLNDLIDIENAVIVDVEATPARTYDEVAATRTMLDRTEERFDLTQDPARPPRGCPRCRTTEDEDKGVRQIARRTKTCRDALRPLENPPRLRANAFECRQILGDGPLLTLLLRPLEFVGCLAVIAARVRLDDL